MRAKQAMLGLLAIGCGLAVTACGSTGKSSNASVREAAGIRFATCMRTHGVPNLPDPGSSGGIQIGGAINPNSPAFQAAQKACFHLLPGGGPGRGASSEARKVQLVRLAQCMRSHGISEFPDPTASPPASPPAGGIAFGSPGAFIAVSQSLMNSPGFRQAAAACQFPGFGLPKGGARKDLRLAP